MTRTRRSADARLSDGGSVAGQERRPPPPQPPPPFPRTLFVEVEPDVRRSGGLAVRLSILGLVAVAAFAVLGLRLWSLQVVGGERYERLAHRQTVRVLRLPGLRGPIVDRRGRLVAGVGARPVVTADPAALGRVGPGGRWRPSRLGRRVLARLASASGTPVAVLVRRIERGRARDPVLPAVVLQRPSRELVFFLAERAIRFPGVALVDVPDRFYPAGPVGSSFLGLLGEIDAARLGRPAFRGYRAGDVIGRSGLEARYDRLLRAPAELVRRRVDALGRPVGPPLASHAPAPKRGLGLTIDLPLQRAAERALRDGVARARAAGHRDANAGAAVVLDPRDGSVLALASFPSYDQARAARDPAYLARLLRAPGRPLFNRAVQGLYPPGSTFKPIVAEAALAAGLITPETILPCTGSLTVGNVVFRNVEPSIDESMDLRRALTVSCDTWFYRVGRLLYRRQVETGRLELQRWARWLGFGRPVGIDIPGEAAGIVPTPAWLARTFRDPSERTWYEGTTINLSIGQGYLAVTPLQLAVAYAALANGGRVVRPHLARAVVDARGNTVRRLRFPPSRRVRLAGAGAIRESLYAAAHAPGGTSASIFGDFPVPVAGKTGTAEMPFGSDTSWYASWAPAGRPRAVVVVMIEHGGFGAEAAAPVAREIYEALFRLRGRRGGAGAAG